MHHWLELDNCPSKKYLDDLNNQKILYSEIVRSPQFCLDDGKYIPEASAFYLKGDKIQLLNNYLNSFLFFSSISFISPPVLSSGFFQ